MDSCRRRVVGAAVAAALTPLGVRGQSSRRLARVAFIDSPPSEDLAGASPADPGLRVFVEELRALGLVEGRNLVLLRRSTGGNVDRAPPIVRDVLAQRVDVIVISGGPAVWAAHVATDRVPIVGIIDDVLDTGVLESLARPGRNLTGVGESDPAIHGKRLQLLKEIAPGIARVGVICYTQGPNDGGRWRRELDAAARTLRMDTVWLAVDAPAGFEPAFARIVRDKIDALCITSTHINNVNAERIAAFALAQRLPSIGFPEAGMLLGYWASGEETYRRAAAQVRKIIAGTPPGVIAFEQPTQFELIINEGTARALGLSIPQPMRVRATRIVA